MKSLWKSVETHTKIGTFDPDVETLRDMSKFLAVDVPQSLHSEIKSVYFGVCVPTDFESDLIHKNTQNCTLKLFLT